jgi:4-hydroxybenzoyl-CoA reductase subunit alpha
VYTNKPPASAMRGFGAPQTLFAAETQMNMAAEELGIDPIDLRLGAFRKSRSARTS